MTEPTDRGDVASSPDEAGEPSSSRSARPGAHVAPKHARNPGSSGRQMPFWQELGLLLVIALVLAVGIKALFLQAFYIPSGSMNDTLVFNDRILVQKVSYWGSASPERGDVVVFADPGGWLDDAAAPQPRNVLAKALEVFGLFPTGGHLVKRVIGVGGDTVACCDKRGRVTVNGTALHERDYLAAGERPSAITFEQEVPEGHLWVLGDNRNSSRDSRFNQDQPGQGFVPVDNVVGRAFLITWPFTRFGLIDFHHEVFAGVPAPAAK